MLWCHLALAPRARHCYTGARFPTGPSGSNRMRLERLEISGFKSFSDRAELAFDEGVTAIVGPNGCGKSNVADAITWVLGEQSAKSLRGDKMEDVIFTGSDARKPGGAAEVRLRLQRPAGAAHSRCPTRRPIRRPPSPSGLDAPESVAGPRGRQRPRQRARQRPRRTGTATRRPAARQVGAAGARRPDAGRRRRSRTSRASSRATSR